MLYFYRIVHCRVHVQLRIARRKPAGNRVCHRSSNPAGQRSRQPLPDRCFLFVCFLEIQEINGDISIYNPFSQFNFWSMSPHCTGRIFNPTAHFTSGGAAFSFTLRSTRNGHFSSVLSLGAFMICASCIEKEFSILWRISYQTVLYLSLFTCNTQ